MAIQTSLDAKKRQQKLLIILGVVVLAGLIVLYFTVWSNGGGSEITINNDDTQIVEKQLTSVVLEEKLKKVDLNIDFFNQTILPFLKLYGNLPVQKGTTGRLNPFTP